MNDAKAKLTDHTAEGEVGLVECQDFVCEEPFTFENGDILPEFTLRYETYGRLNREKSNVILICHALSGDHHCAGVYSVTDRKSGWWNNMVGPGKPIDTNHFYVICINCLGGCQGSTGPSSINPKTGKRYNLNFPLVSIRDMVQAQKRLIDHLGLRELYCVIGGSMGGMQALQWGIDFPGQIRRILLLATTARSSAQSIAFNEVGRCAICQDPEWKSGEYEPGSGPNVGLAVARMMAHITYLSEKGMENKFGRDATEGSEGRRLFDAEFEVEHYLRYQGESFVNRFDANTYLYFTKALDRFDISAAGGLENAFKTIEARVLVVGFTSDWLYTSEQNREIVHAMLRCGKNVSYAELDTYLGHDSFLVHDPQLYDLVRAFLEKNELDSR